MESWLNLLRRQYNYRLHERFDWDEMYRCDVNSCPVNCSIAGLKNRPNYYSQKADLPNSKKLFTEYKDIHSQVLQDCVKRVDKTFERWLKGDGKGKKSGKPRFKGVGRYHSFTYPQLKQDCGNGNKINLPKIGWVKLILHRPIPDGFKIKTATSTKHCDGWYVNLSLEDISVHSLKIDILPSDKNTIGIDVGLKEFLVTSTGEAVTIPQHYRKAEAKLKRCQRKLSRKQKGSNRLRCAVARVAKCHKKVSNKRKDFHYKTAKWLLDLAQVIAVEDLNIKGLAKSRLAKSVNDAGWASFLSILGVKAESAGQLVIAVDPRNTTQNCSGCGVKVPKTLSDRLHVCKCGVTLDRDHNAAINIRKLAVGHSVTAQGGPGQKTPCELRSPHCTALSGQ
jgi:putative transposase